MLKVILSYCASEDVALMVLYVCVYHDAYVVLTALYSSEEYSVCAE